MGLSCSICRHADRAEIDKELFARTPLRTVADRWSVSKTALIRHKNKCVKNDVIALKEKTSEVCALSVADRMNALITATQKIIDDIVSEKKQDRRLLLQAVEVMRRHLELMAKLTGDIRTGVQVGVQTGVAVQAQGDAPQTDICTVIKVLAGKEIR